MRIDDDPIKNIARERNKTHGDYTDVAVYTAQFRQILETATIDRKADSRIRLSDRQRLSLDMICNKIARILAGNPSEEEHWKDIAGYAYIANTPEGEYKDADGN